MEDNPYFGLLKAMEGEPAQPVIAEGKVVSISPLKVQSRGMDLSGNELLTSSNFIDDLQAGKVSVGDKLLLLTDDNQLFYLICKVVNG